LLSLVTLLSTLSHFSSGLQYANGHFVNERGEKHEKQLQPKGE